MSAVYFPCVFVVVWSVSQYSDIYIVVCCWPLFIVGSVLIAIICLFVLLLLFIQSVMYYMCTLSVLCRNAVVCGVGNELFFN